MDTHVCSNQTPLASDTSIEPATKQPLAKSIACALKDQITQGFWKQGEQLPSVRELTRKWGVSHVTIIRALEEVVSQGYARTVSGRGSFVTFDALASPQSDFSPHSNADNIGLQSETRKLYQAIQKHARGSAAPSSIDIDSPNDNDSLGYLPLRAAIASYLRRQRKIICNAQQIAIFQNKKAVIDLLSRLLIAPGINVLFESPADLHAQKCLLFAGANLSGCTFDENENAQFNSILAEQAPKLIVMSAQFVNPSARHNTLVERLFNYASAGGALIVEECIEDDFYFGAEIPTLKSKDACDAVIYLGVFPRFIKSMSPIAFALMPEKLVLPVQTARETFGMECSQLEQRMLAHHIEDGHLERHLLRIKTTVNLERAKVIGEFTRQLRGICSIICPPKGTCLIIKFSQEFDGDAICRAAIHAGLLLEPTDQFHMSEAPHGEFRLQFAGLEVDEVFSQKLAAFKRCILA